MYTKPEYTIDSMGYIYVYDVTLHKTGESNVTPVNIVDSDVDLQELKRYYSFFFRDELPEYSKWFRVAHVDYLSLKDDRYLRITTRYISGKNFLEGRRF